MSDTWKVQLVYSDAKSNKFWRARTEGGTMFVNYGRIGSDGQTQTKEFGSAAEAAAALDKQAASKRKKGYTDSGEAAADDAPAAAEVPPALPEQPDAVTLVLDKGGRDVRLDLRFDGKVVRTEVSETYTSAEEAAAAFVRIQQALTAEGYKIER